jgi:hypothetical protein
VAACGTLRAVLTSAKVIDLESLPVWSLWVFAMAGLACLFGAARWVLPPSRRYQRLWVVPVAVVALAVRAATAVNPRGVLWIWGLIGFAGLTILFMGRMPADMPSAKDPAVRAHPQYAALVRRGRITGVALLGSIVVLLVLSANFVQGF